MEWHWETQKKIWEKRVGKGSSGTTKWHKWVKLAQVGQMEQVEAGLQIYVEQVEQEQGGLQIPWNMWNKDKGSVPLNLSTWPNVELQGRESFHLHTWGVSNFTTQAMSWTGSFRTFIVYGRRTAHERVRKWSEFGWK